MEKIWECKIGGKVGDMPAGADGPMRRAVQTAFKTLTGVEASFTFSGWGATLTEVERAVHENRDPNWDAMQEAIGAGDGTLHGAIEYWHEEALRLCAELAACREALSRRDYDSDGGDVPVSEQLRRMAKDAGRYRLLRRKFAIISDGEGNAEFCPINLPRPTYIAPSSAIELDTALDRERLGLGTTMWE